MVQPVVKIDREIPTIAPFSVIELEFSSDELQTYTVLEDCHNMATAKELARSEVVLAGREGNLITLRVYDNHKKHIVSFHPSFGLG